MRFEELGRGVGGGKPIESSVRTWDLAYMVRVFRFVHDDIFKTAESMGINGNHESSRGESAFQISNCQILGTPLG